MSFKVGDLVRAKAGTSYSCTSRDVYCKVLDYSRWENTMKVEIIQKVDGRSYEFSTKTFNVKKENFEKYEGGKTMSNAFKVGDKVRRTGNDCPYGNGSVQKGDIGTIISIEGTSKYKVNFRVHSSFAVDASNIELVTPVVTLPKKGDTVEIIKATSGAPSSTNGRKGVILNDGDGAGENYQIQVEGQSTTWYYNKSEFKVVAPNPIEKTLTLTATELANLTCHGTSCRDCVNSGAETCSETEVKTKVKDFLAEIRAEIEAAKVPVETPEQAKVRELKATIEKASKEVQELERSMK